MWKNKTRKNRWQESKIWENKDKIQKWKMIEGNVKK